jgi:preprotein translocase subunit SecB
MTENYKILAKFIKDISAETPNLETYIFVKNYIAKYNLHIDITSLAIKNRIIEINTKLSLSDPNESEKKIYFEIIYATVVKIDETIKNSKEIEKIVLCDVQNKIYPELEKIFLKLIVDSGYPEPKPNKKIDFEELYKNKNN